MVVSDWSDQAAASERQLAVGTFRRYHRIHALTGARDNGNIAHAREFNPAKRHD